MAVDFPGDHRLSADHSFSEHHRLARCWRCSAWTTSASSSACFNAAQIKALVQSVTPSGQHYWMEPRPRPRTTGCGKATDLARRRLFSVDLHRRRFKRPCALLRFGATCARCRPVRPRYAAFLSHFRPSFNSGRLAQLAGCGVELQFTSVCRRFRSASPPVMLFAASAHKRIVCPCGLGDCSTLLAQFWRGRFRLISLFCGRSYRCTSVSPDQIRVALSAAEESVRAMHLESGSAAPLALASRGWLARPGLDEPGATVAGPACGRWLVATLGYVLFPTWAGTSPNPLLESSGL